MTEEYKLKNKIENIIIIAFGLTILAFNLGVGYGQNNPASIPSEYTDPCWGTPYCF